MIRPPSAFRPAAEAITVAVATSVAVLAIMLPISFANLSASLYVDLLVFNIPRAMTGGAFVAVLTAAVTVAVGSARTARWTALLALVGILLSHLVLVPDSSVDTLDGLSLPTLNFLDALLAGIVFGALAVAVWNEPLLRGAYLFAAIGATILGDLTQSPTDETGGGLNSALGGALPLWFIAASVLALGYFALTDTPPPVSNADSAIPLAPVFAAVIAFSAIIVTSSAVSNHKTSLGYVAVAALSVVVAATVAALVLPGRDGVLVLLMTAFAVAGSLVPTLPRAGWIDLATLAAIAAGVLVGLRRPVACAAAIAVVALACLTLLTDLVEFPAAPAAAVGCLALGAVGGYCVGTAVPVNSASAVVGLSILFVPSLGVALSDTELGHLAYSSAWYRTSEVARGPIPATIALVIALACAAVIGLLVRRRPAR